MATGGGKYVDKLRKFKSSVKNAADLFSSATEVLKYNFGGRYSLKQLVEECWFGVGDDKVKDAIRQIMSDLCEMIFASTRDSITSFANEKGLTINLTAVGNWPIYERCEGSKLAKVTCDSLVLFHALYETRSINGVFSNSQLDEMEEIFSPASTLLKLIGPKGLETELPFNVIATLDGESYKHMPDDMNAFAREDGVITAHSYERVRQAKMMKEEPLEKDEEKIAELVAGCRNVFEQIASKQYNIDQMMNLASLSTVGTIGEAEELMKSFSTCLLTVVDVYDIRVLNAYLKLMKKLFVMCENIDNPMRQLYADFYATKNELPSLKPQYTEYGSDFVNLMNGMGDHAQFQNNVDKLDRVVREFAFLSLIAPKNTIWLVLKECINNRLIVPNILKIFRRIPALLELKLELGKVEGGTSAQKLPLITLALRRIVLKEGMWLESAETRANFIYLVSAMARERRCPLKPDQVVVEEGATRRYGEVIDKAVSDGSELLLDFVLPWIFSTNGAEIALELLSRMFADHECKRTPIEWNLEIDEKIFGGNDELNSALENILKLISCGLGKDGYFEQFPAPICVKLLIDILCFMNGKSAMIEELSLKCLSLLGEKLKEEKVLFPEKTRNFLSDVLNGHVWTLKYAVLSWFSECFETPKLQIPEALYKSLSAEKQCCFEQITTDFDFAPVEGFLKSIFDLGAVSPDLAIDLISEGISIKPLDEELSTKMALAFIDSIPESVSNAKLVAMCDVVDSMVDTLLPTLKSNPLMFCNESTIYGLHLTAPLSILGDAVILAQRAMGIETTTKNQQIAEKLLSVWCQRAKTHIEREVIDLRRSRLPHVPFIRDPRPIPDGVNIDRLLRVKVQITELFSTAVMITKAAENVTQQLRILLVTLADYDAEVNQMETGPALDHIRTDSKDSGTFYAFAHAEGIGHGSEGDEKKITEEVADRFVNNKNTTLLTSDNTNSVEGNDERKVPVMESVGTTKSLAINGAHENKLDKSTEIAIPMFGSNGFHKEGTSATNALFELNAGSTVVPQTSSHHNGLRSENYSEMAHFDEHTDEFQWSRHGRRGMEQQHSRRYIGDRGRSGRWDRDERWSRNGRYWERAKGQQKSMESRGSQNGEIATDVMASRETDNDSEWDAESYSTQSHVSPAADLGDERSVGNNKGNRKIGKKTDHWRREATGFADRSSGAILDRHPSKTSEHGFPNTVDTSSSICEYDRSLQIRDGQNKKPRCHAEKLVDAECMKGNTKDLATALEKRGGSEESDSIGETISKEHEHLGGFMKHEQMEEGNRRLAGRSQLKKNVKTDGLEDKRSCFSTERAHRSGHQEWKGYRAKNPIRFETGNAPRISTSAAAFKSTPMKTNIAPEHTSSSAAMMSSRDQKRTDDTLKAMMEQVDDEPTRDMLERKMDSNERMAADDGPSSDSQQSSPYNNAPIQSQKKFNGRPHSWNRGGSRVTRGGFHKLPKGGNRH